MSTKTCSRCQKELPEDSFAEIRPNIRRNVCKGCRGARVRELRSSGYFAYLKRLIINTKSQRRGGFDFDLTSEYLKELWEKQEGRCAISGVILTHHTDGTGKKEFNASIDRIDSMQGYIPGNVQLVALRVNLLKNTLSTDMLYWWVKTIHAYSCD